MRPYGPRSFPDETTPLCIRNGQRIGCDSLGLLVIPH